MSRIRSALFAKALLLLALAGCNSGGDAPVAPADPPAATAPSITTQPLAVSAVAGQSATFNVTASGTGPFTYQWRRNGVDIPGATSASYIAAPVAAADDGVSYSVVVTNGMGSITSAGALLTVTLPAGTAASIEVEQTTALLTAIGATVQLGARPVDASGAPVAGAITWESSNPADVSVDGSGRITAHAIGSTMLFASADGRRSQPIFVMVAEPVPGALVLEDAQIVAIGAPIGLTVDEVPEVGTQYEVTVSGLSAAPAPGTAVLAAGEAPVAGTVVSSRAEAGNLVLMLELAALPDLLARYDLDWDVDLSTLPVASIDIDSTRDALLPERASRKRDGAAEMPRKFERFKCEGEFRASLMSTKISLAPELHARLQIRTSRDDPRLPPGYARLVLTGSQGLRGTASIKVEPGFSASVECIAQAQVKIPVGGLVSVIVMPALRLGVGFTIDGRVVATSGELSLSGMVGISETLGFECMINACHALSDVSIIDDFKLTKRVPTLNDMHVDLSGHVFAVAGIDAVFGLGLANAEIVEARVGPKQEFELATADDQAKNAGMASNYSLSLDAVIQPGSALRSALKKLIDDDTVTLNFRALHSEPLGESPKGTLDVSATNVAFGTPVEFQVHLSDPVTYPLLGDGGETQYNVDHVYLYRKKQGEAEFTAWQTFPVAENQTTFQYEWTPTSADMGDYEFAAFTETRLPVPVLEVAPNSIKRLHVRGPGWAGNITLTIEGRDTVEENGISPGGTSRKVTTYTDNGSGQFELETFPDAFGLPILQVANGSGTISRLVAVQSNAHYVDNDCTVISSGTSESVETGTLVAAMPSYAVISFNGDGSYQLQIPYLLGPTTVTTHTVGQETRTGHPTCRSPDPVDITRESPGNFRTSILSVRGLAEASATTLAGSDEVTVDETPDHVYSISWSLRKH